VIDFRNDINSPHTEAWIYSNLYIIALQADFVKKNMPCHGTTKGIDDPYGHGLIKR
jgi:hypothetical protein